MDSQGALAVGHSNGADPRRNFVFLLDKNGDCIWTAREEARLLISGLPHIDCGKEINNFICSNPASHRLPGSYLISVLPIASDLGAVRAVGFINPLLYPEPRKRACADLLRPFFPAVAMVLLSLAVAAECVFDILSHWH